MVICRDCKRLLPIFAFGKNPTYKIGRSSQCKECRAKWHRKYYQANREKISLKAKRYYQENSLKIRTAKSHKPWPEDKKQKYAETAKGKYRIEIRARSVVATAIKNGTLKRVPCAICGNKKSHAHHNDYKKPLEVIWFCSQHHGAWHRLFIPEHASHESSQRGL